MRLAGIEIRDFRSIFLDETGRPLSMDLGEGMNTLVGLNNCGKSNVLRAISLALDPHHPFDPALDAPGPRQFSLPTIKLRFLADGDRAEDKEVLDATDEYERGLGRGSSTVATGGEVVLQVAFQQEAGGYRRREVLLTRDNRVPSTPQDEERLTTALAKLRDAVRFVLISSGESIASVLEGNLREILHSVIRERLSEAFSDAERSRQEYITGLQESLLAPLRDRLAEDVGGLFPEIEAIYLSPEVLTIERTLANVGVSLEDLVVTPLDQKGTGVRGGVLVAMLSYLALNATRGMVFAVEEPEAFLHPASQEDVRDHLEQLATSRDVSLLVTTHSPYLVSRVADGRVFCLAKDVGGRTRVAQVARGDARHSSLIGDLFREVTFAEMLTQATELPDGAKGVLLVEGDGDELSLRLAAKVVGRDDLLDGIHIQPAGGTKKIVAQAVIARAATNRPVFVLLDNDDAGKDALKLLTGEKFGFQKGKQVVTYRVLFPAGQADFPYEAEDVFDPAVIQAFVDSHGPAVCDGSRRRPDGAFHYDLSQAAKATLESHIDSYTRPEHVERWIELILLVRSRLDLPEIAQTAAEIVAAAPKPAKRESEPNGSALIIAHKLDYARYEDTGALILDVEYHLPAGLTRIGFYADAALQMPIASIVADYPALLISEGTAAQLRSTGVAPDARTADVIEELVTSDDSLANSTQHLVLLTRADDPETLLLPAPVRNTRVHRDGRPLAWAVGTKLVHFAALARLPSTTGELDSFEAEASQNIVDAQAQEDCA